MKIKEILPKSCICSHLKSNTKEGVLEELASLISLSFPEIKKNEIYQILLDREKLGSTGIGNGVAIPHGKSSAINKIITCFGKSKTGINFDSQDGKPSHLFFVLVAPENAAGMHLKALAHLSRLLKDVHFRNKLIEAENSEDLYLQIILEDEKYGSP